ncbi:hypothetical protein [Glaciecola sp.]|uniref:hypothetical protein n=1 Tax=Glaciecola sp. MF2-115 TaxID=3384827 RepID=UPI003988ABBA
MDISGTSASAVSGALEIKSAQMAKSRIEQDGQAALQLLEAADVPKPTSSNGLGSVIDTYA